MVGMNATTVEVFMTASPHTIGRDQPLTVAKDLMSRHGIRHLPVLEGGQLVGVVSERDVAFLGSVRDVDASQLTVGEAMSAEVYTVSPGELLRNAAATMARCRYGSAIVVDGNRVVGMFTTVDALRALQAVLDASSV
jgi:acetoin utilization protein AcuB